MRPGVNTDSHGLKVAQLAGMPVAAMEVAKDTLSRLRRIKDNAGDTSTQLSIAYEIPPESRIAHMKN
jgi:DNA mismatch repair ATPase MutS